MSRDEDEEMYDPVAEGEHAVAGGREPYRAAQEPCPHFSVLIAADGSAAIDGVSVTAGEGQALDAAILDALQGYARERNTPVTAAVSDPGAANVTFVEVAPDGSSRLMEQAPAQAGSYGAGYEAEPALDVDDFIDVEEEFPQEGPLHHDGVEGGLPDHGVPYDEDEDEDEDEGDAYALPRSAEQSPGPRPPSPLLRRTAADGPGISRQSDDEFRGPGLLHRPLVVGPVAVSVAALVVVPLFILGSGGGAPNQATGLREDGGRRSPSSLSPAPRRTTPPAVSVSPSLLPPPPDTTAKPKPTTTAGGGTTATVTVRPPQVTTTVTTKPAAPETAATVVNRLAARAPGRHICYRAYISGRGWQQPVCDGRIAGTTGQGRAIKALNIAVRGTGGVAANAFVHNPTSTDGQGVWMPEWTPNTANGKNIYIGSVMQGAPDMLAFAVNIGSGGRICQTASVHKSGWGHTGCANPRPGLATGGTFENDLWLEAVKFTV
ncbi:hypothetical protein ABZ619_17055 [Streptomyces sp. NPDC007851]|uniref:hypothetical protein n=1 Tax=Streptomyces sp. NPDC007851 TaxID=3155008 RepID=UPI0033D5D5A9